MRIVCCLGGGVAVAPPEAAVVTAGGEKGGVGRRVRVRVGEGGGRRVVASPDAGVARGVAIMMK